LSCLQVGESITEVEIGDWLKHPGESVNQDEPVVVIETEKVTVELPAPASGTITETLKRKGDKAAVGDVIGYMETNGAVSLVGA
jgi:2-oxoglutarate dehydrogenase E2 component (dihydrolipoamide succinyltransferase)